MTDNPYQPPQSAVGAGPTSSATTAQFELLRSGQRLVVFAIVVYLAAVIGRFIAPPLALAAFVALILGIIGIIRLTGGLGFNAVIRILLVISMLIPIIGLIVLVVLNSKATAMLRAAGYKVGLFGAAAR